MLYIFAILFGIFGGASFAVWPGCAAAIKNALPANSANTAFILASLLFGRGLGFVFSGPVSSQLLRGGWKGDAKFAYGSDYGAVIVFTGVSALLGATAWLGRLFRVM